MAKQQQETERRFVRSEDPDLSPEANRLLTREAQAVVGAEQVEVPKDAPRERQDAHAGHTPLTSNAIQARQVLLLTFTVALVVGAVLTVAFDSWWFLVGAAAIHAIGAGIVGFGVVQMTTQTEHVSPATAAALEEEGVADPDRALTELVAQYEGAREQGPDDLDADAAEEPGRAAVEQRSALTPSSRGGEAAGAGSAVAALPYWVVGGMTVLSVVIAVALGGGEAWVVPAVVVPLGVAWFLLQRVMAGSDGDEVTGRSLAPLIAALGAAVAVYLVVMGIVTDAL